MRGANGEQNFIGWFERQKAAVRKKIVRDEINEAVKRDSQTNRQSEFVSARHQTDWKKGENQRKNVVQFEKKFVRLMMRLMNSPQNAVK